MTRSNFRVYSSNGQVQVIHSATAPRMLSSGCRGELFEVAVDTPEQVLALSRVGRDAIGAELPAHPLVRRGDAARMPVDVNDLDIELCHQPGDQVGCPRVLDENPRTMASSPHARPPASPNRGRCGRVRGRFQQMAGRNRTTAHGFLEGASSARHSLGRATLGLRYGVAKLVHGQSWPKSMSRCQGLKGSNTW